MNLGLDELMIVNPAPGRLAGSTAGRAASTPRYFLGDDGSLYRLQPAAAPRSGHGLRGDYFLGDDGTLFQTIARRPR